MFKIESYITPILLSYVDKYVKDFNPADAQVSLWGGGVVLHNLVVKTDVLQHELSLPFTLVSGRIHELVIQVPWTKIMSEPIVVTIDTIECVLGHRLPSPTEDTSTPETYQRTQDVSAPPGYMQALVRRIVSNISLKVHHLILKFVADDIVMSVNVKHLAIDSAGVNWEPSFADIDQNDPVLRRLIRLDDLTLCLDSTDSDGKIRFYQEPLLYRCQLNFRVLTRLASSTTRRAISHHVQLRSSKLAWGVTNEQVTLLLRLICEYDSEEANRQQQASSRAPLSPTTPSYSNPTNTADPNNGASWSEWAWSWLPAWAEKDLELEDASKPTSPCPFLFVGYLDSISLVYKIMEKDTSGRKRARGVLEFNANYAAFKGAISTPLLYQITLGARTINLSSNGKCVCGLYDYNSAKSYRTTYITKLAIEDEEATWEWPEDNFEHKTEQYRPGEELQEDNLTVFTERSQSAPDQPEQQPQQGTGHDQAPGEQKTPQHQQMPEIVANAEEASDKKDASVPSSDEFWLKMAPLIFFDFKHERLPPVNISNPHDSPPADFQYSDWVERCIINIQLGSMELRVSKGLIHRISSILDIFKRLPAPPVLELPMRTLTIEECEALYDNMPQKRVNFEWVDLKVRIRSCDHDLIDRVTSPPLYLDLNTPKIKAVLTAPLYSQRVCMAACQLPRDDGPLWRGARVHFTLSMKSIQMSLCSPSDGLAPRPVARLDVNLAIHHLLHQEMFAKKDSVKFSYSLKIKELNICGSAARLQAASTILLTVLSNKSTNILKNTTLCHDALQDEESVAIDATIEDITIRGFLTRNINTHIAMVQSARATTLYALNGPDLKQAWLFSGPDIPTTYPYLRVALQWCVQPTSEVMDYIGIWTEPTAVCFDPLFITWLAYKPHIQHDTSYAAPTGITKTMSSSAYLARRRTTPTSSSGRGASKQGSGAELVHAVRPRSLGSSSEPTEHKQAKVHVTETIQEQWWSGDRLVTLHRRLQHALVSIELGLVLAYVTMTTTSAVDSATVRDAMEGHVVAGNSVLALSLGSVSIHSNAVFKQLWHEVRHDGPTIFATKSKLHLKEDDCFPWKMRLADVSCYTLEVQVGAVLKGREKASGLRSQLKVSAVTTPRNILEMLTTTITLSVVTKTLPIKNIIHKMDSKKNEPSEEEKTMEYFNAGLDFKPSTLKEFVRGPASRRSESPEKPKSLPVSVKPDPTGPVVSIGVCLHADTPPIIFKVDHDQVYIVTGALHCFKHLITLANRTTDISYSRSSSLSRRSMKRSESEMDEQSRSEVTPPENRSEMISIYETVNFNKIKTSFWFQWVISRVSVIFATASVKLAFNIDDVISTVDLQNHYKQLKVKLSSVSVRHYERTESDEWTCGVLGGRVLEAREPANAPDEIHFLTITVTQAEISNLPDSWKDELHPKMLQSRSTSDSMWEIYATLAPLEAVLRSKVMNQLMELMQEMAPRTFCTLPSNNSISSTTSWQWPFCYITAGGLRLLVMSDLMEERYDDTLMFTIGKAILSPHPENPICRKTISTGSDGVWITPGGGFEGRQYEIKAKNISIHSTKLVQLVNQEKSENELENGGNTNPALKWTQQLVSPVITPILHNFEVSFVMAPALYLDDTLVCGPALELNMLSDLALDISMPQLKLASNIASELKNVMATNITDENNYDDENHGMCPYYFVDMINSSMEDLTDGDTRDATISKFWSTVDLNRASKDSGVDDTTASTAASTNKSVKRGDYTSRKTPSVAFVEDSRDNWEYLEVVLTLGMVELILYSTDNNSHSEETLPSDSQTPEKSVKSPQTLGNEQNLQSEGQEDSSQRSDALSISYTDILHPPNTVDCNLESSSKAAPTNRRPGNVLLLHVKLHQPNMYYCRRHTHKSLQMSLFNLWIGIGDNESGTVCEQVLVSTAPGTPDPATDIPPALATMKAVIPLSTGGPALYSILATTRGTVNLDIERPVLLEVSMDRINTLRSISTLVKEQFTSPVEEAPTHPSEQSFFYDLRHFMVRHMIECVTINTTQLGVSGRDGAGGWDSASLQLATGARPERLVARALVSAFLLSVGPSGEKRHPLLHPLMFGVDLECSWEAWRRAEGGLAAKEPVVQLVVDIDHLNMDVRPEDAVTLLNVKDSINVLRGKQEDTAEADHMEYSSESIADFTLGSSGADNRFSTYSGDSTDIYDHYYKDDLRSGAFKILRGGQLPMAYQVMLNGDYVSWRYPHPRAITRIIVFPIPNQDEEVDCVLERYSRLMGSWEPHTYFKLPATEQQEIKLYIAPPHTIFAPIWRFRLYPNKDKKPTFQFNARNYMPRVDPLVTEARLEDRPPMRNSGVTADQLCGMIRVDSYFSPRVLPRMRTSLRMGGLSLHLHNTKPQLSGVKFSVEGYNYSKLLMKSHRVFSVALRDTMLYAQLTSPAGHLILVKTNALCNIIDSATGTMEQMMSEATLQSGLSMLSATGQPRVRFHCTPLHIKLHVPRLRTIQSLLSEWTRQLSQNSVDLYDITNVKNMDEALEGRLCLWICNNTTVELRLGQEGTEQSVPLEAGEKVAYRWRSPSAPRKLHISLAGPENSCEWSNSIDMNETNTACLRLQEPDTASDNLYVHACVSNKGAIRTLTLAGRLTVANMMRLDMAYKIKAWIKNTWKTVFSGVINAESIDNSVLCAAECNCVLKLKFINHAAGWSGDIPLRGCPKENVPWLVKVPCAGEIPYISVWCRVVRAQSDGRILATVWPLYILRSHLPLDIDVTLTTETDQSMSTSERINPQLVHSAMGRGQCTHLLTPGTTAAMHRLSFQYKNIDTPVTRDDVPLHYGVADTSVFEKKVSVNDIEDVISELKKWLINSSVKSNTSWPYSSIVKHRRVIWVSALLQPRADVTVRYQAVRAGGGCSLVVEVRPVVLFCNASPLAITLRAHDAAPLCKLEPGTAIAPPSIILQKPFYMSIEIGRDTYVSGELGVCREELGRYTTAPRGRVAVDSEYPAIFSIHCHEKVALLTLYYELKHDINILGVSSTYVVLNHLDTSVLIAPLVIPYSENSIPLRPKKYKTIHSHKGESDLFTGIPVCNFWVYGRWRGGEVTNHYEYMCVTLPTVDTNTKPVPLRLRTEPTRTAIALKTQNNQSMAVVVTQQRVDGRILVTIAKDPCPQYVIENKTKTALVVGQPLLVTDEPTTSSTVVSPECEGARWYVHIGSGSVTHYSTPAYCSRFPATTPREHSKEQLTFLTFAFPGDELEPKWCAPVAVTCGEHLLQLSDGSTIKLRVHPHPHSTLLELLNVDQNDISASDIRRRLLCPKEKPFQLTNMNQSLLLERTDANEKLLHNFNEIKVTTAGECEPDAVVVLDAVKSQDFSSLPNIALNTEVKTSSAQSTTTAVTVANVQDFSPDQSHCINTYAKWETSGSEWTYEESIRGVLTGVIVELAMTSEEASLVVLNLDRIVCTMFTENKARTATLSIADMQVDNRRFENGQFDFSVVAATSTMNREDDDLPTLWNIFVEVETFELKSDRAHLLLKTRFEQWKVNREEFQELTEVEVRVGPLALYIEDAYLAALVELLHVAVPPPRDETAARLVAEVEALRRPLRLRRLMIHPLHMTLTLHTSVRMYIALDQSPLRLNTFQLQDVMTYRDSLVHSLTVHYLSAVILGAGWVVGGLELLGAPGTLASRVTSAGGGMRGLAVCTAAAIVRSLSAWADSIARNLDLLAGDEEHSRRAAAARRPPPGTLVQGLAHGATNLAVNLLGAVGGLAHHPLVGVAVGETEGASSALRRSLVGALTKPLSATADLVALAGHGLLRQTGWDPAPQQRTLTSIPTLRAGWERDCVRWCFRLTDLTTLAGFEVLFDNAPVNLLLTHECLLVTDPDTDVILEMIDFKFCSIGPYQGPVIEFFITQQHSSHVDSRNVDEDSEYQICAAAMARVARYTGAEGAEGATEQRPRRRVTLLPAPALHHALHAALAALIHHNARTHLHLL